MNVRARVIAQLRDAAADLQRNQFDKAMRGACAAVVLLLTQVDVHRARTMLPVAQFLECGVIYVTVETGLRAEFHKAQFSHADCARALAAAEALLYTPMPRSWWERAHAALHTLSVQVMQGTLQEGCRRLALRVLHALKFPLRRRLPHARRRDEASAMVIGFLLNEPLARASALVKAHALQSELRYRQNRDVAATQEPFVWPERADYRDWLRRNPGSRVLVTVHMGNFLGAFRCLASEAESGRQVLSLQRELQQDLSSLHLVDARLQHQVLTRTPSTSAKAVAALRSGHATLAILCDLSSRHGETVTVPFFGVPARLVRGPALLAILGRAPLVPFVTFEHNGRDHLQMAPVLPTALQPGESLAEGVMRLTGMLAEVMERWIRQAPGQWRFLPAAAMYLAAPVQEEHPHAN